MTKSDLKTGMTVETEYGTLLKVLKDVDTVNYGNQEVFFFRRGIIIDGFTLGSDYSEDLTFKDKDAGFDIVRVYDKESDNQILVFSTEKLLWQRKEPRKMTVADVEALVGEKVEIISEN